MTQEEIKNLKSGDFIKASTLSAKERGKNSGPDRYASLHIVKGIREHDNVVELMQVYTNHGWKTQVHMKTLTLDTWEYLGEG